ncbi:MAG: methyltransferase domain-containing protein [Eubacteriales bacterium]|nr:methyltransferase domain-containing protein [Eubacteriales bacterium]
MIDIKSFLICPECMSELSNELVCERCGNVYSYKYGVFDIISENLSKRLNQMNRKDFDELFEDETVEITFEDVNNTYKNKETIEAEYKMNTYMKGLIEDFSGVVCDLATGFGVMLQKLLDSQNKNFNIICTDIEKALLVVTRRIKKTDDNRVFYIASDGRYMSIKDQTIDYITSRSAFGGIPESDKVARELYRILKPGGKLIIYGRFIEEGSKSLEIAKSQGPALRTVDEFLNALESGGFENIDTAVVSEVIWAENDFIHAAGDKISYCIITAQRIECKSKKILRCIDI